LYPATVKGEPSVYVAGAAQDNFPLPMLILVGMLFFPAPPDFPPGQAETVKKNNINKEISMPVRTVSCFVIIPRRAWMDDFLSFMAMPQRVFPVSIKILI